MPRQGTRRLQGVHHALEWNIFMRVCFQGKSAYPFHQFCEAGIAGNISAHDQIVYKEAHQVLEFFFCASSDYGADGNVVACA